MNVQHIQGLVHTEHCRYIYINIYMYVFMYYTYMDIYASTCMCVYMSLQHIHI